MKKFLVLLVAMILVLAACSGGSDSTSSEGEASEITLTYGIWDKNQAPIMEEIIQKFNESHPNINVKVEVTPWSQYWTKLEAAATGGALPDLFWMNGPNFQKYASNEILLPISEQIEADGVGLENYPEALVDLYSLDGTNYALPKDFDSIALWYNKELFDAAGVSYPDETWDWNTFVDAAKKLTNAEKNVWGFAASLAGQEGYYNTVPQSGGFIISDDKKSSGYDQPETIEGIQFLTDMIHVHKVSPTHEQMVETSGLDLFESGKVAMVFTGSWDNVRFSNNEYTKDKVDVAVLPKGKERTGVLHGLGNVIAANTEHPKEAWEFLKFLGSKEAAEIQAEKGVIPAFNGTQDAWVNSSPQFNLQAHIDMAEVSVPYPASKNTSKWVEIETEYLAKAWAGEMSVEEACKMIAEKMNEVLAEE